MSNEQTDEHGKPDSHDREFGKRLASWWNHGAEKAMQSQATPVASEITKCKAA